MTTKNSTIWVITIIGCLSAFLSLFLFFSTIVYAACEAEVECANGMPKICNCAGAGTCVSSGNCAECVCAGGTYQKVCCKNDMEFE